MTAFTLRPYQQEASSRAVDFFTSKKTKNGIIVLPTGSGKSLVIADIANKLNDHVLIFQPSKEILEQNFDKLLSYGVIDCSIYSASFNSKQISRITFATIGSVKSKPDLFSHFKYIIIDECHGVNAKGGMYDDFISSVSCKVLGLTATPYRLHSDNFGGSILKFITRTRPRIFSEVIYHVQISELYNSGFLSKMEYFSIDIVDTNKLKVNSTGADYTDKSVQQYYESIGFKDQLKQIIERLMKAGRKNILVFTRFIKEAEELSDHLKWFPAKLPKKKENVF